MWDIEIIKQVGDLYIVMTPNGDTHCINENELQIFIKKQ
jgi:hypothetical protein